MMIQVRLFAGMRQQMGVDVVKLELPSRASVADLRAEMSRQYTQLDPMLTRARIAVDERYVDDDHIIPPDAAVACIPPVSGG